MTPQDATALVTSFFAALERFDVDAVAPLLADDVVHVEHPNAIAPRGFRRDRAGMLAGVTAGRQTLAAQRYTLRSILVDGDRVAFEADWVGVLAKDAGSRRAGDEMRARFGAFFTLRAGQVVRWENYDCFDP